MPVSETVAPSVLSPLGLIRHVPDRPPPDGISTVAELVAHSAGAFGAAEALVGRFRRLTYAEVQTESERVAAGLATLGVGAGDRVAGCLANHPEIVIAFLATQRLGAIWVGVNRALAPPEKLHQLKDSGAVVFLADAATIAEVDRDAAPDLTFTVAVDVTASDPWSSLPADLSNHEEGGGTATLADVGQLDPYAPAAIAYTSGTTGRPKGVVHSQHNLLLVGAVLAVGRSGSHRTGVCLPLTILNLQVLGPLSVLRTGGCCVTMDRIDAPGVADWVKRERITILSAVPTIVHDLMTDPAIDPGDLATLQSLGAGGLCSDQVQERYEARFGRRVQSVYGLTEAPTIVTMPRPGDPVSVGSSGRALPHLRVEILGPDGRPASCATSGEISVVPADSGPWAGCWTPMLGYWQQTEATHRALAGTRLRTGDIGRVDEGGNLFVSGRADSVIRRGGANVYPAEVERVLNTAGAVAGSIVFGVVDERLGQRPVAALEPRPGCVIDLDDLRAHLAENLARYKIPADIYVLDRLPRNQMGRVVEREVRTLVGLSGDPS